MSPTVYRIHTPRLVVRCWEPADAPQLMAAKNASKEHLLPWMPWALGEPSDLAANLALIRAWHAQFDTDQDYVYGIFDRATSAVVGGTGLHERIGKNAREIGYWVCAGATNRGIATEAAAALTRMGFEFMGLDRMEIHCDVRNVWSAAIPRKLGYVHDATLRRRAITVGAPADSMIWTLFADEYPGSPAAQIAIEAFDALGGKLAPLARTGGAAMKYRRLGRTGLKVSVVGLGTWQFGGEWGRAFTQAEVDRLLGHGAELGINLIDTAECYGDHLSEALIGRAIRGQRERWIVATKFGHKFHSNFTRTLHYSAAEVLEQLEASLRALDTDTIDLYQMHSAKDAAFDQPDLWEMLSRQVQAGKIRHVGLSISPNDNLYQTAGASAVGAETIQVVYNRLDRAPEAAVLPTCQAQDLGVLARVPLASGLLTGKYRPGDVFDNPDDIRSQRSPSETAGSAAAGSRDRGD